MPDFDVVSDVIFNCFDMCQKRFIINFRLHFYIIFYILYINMLHLVTYICVIILGCVIIYYIIFGSGLY